jgi:hypothetical protein
MLITSHGGRPSAFGGPIVLIGLLATETFESLTRQTVLSWHETINNEADIIIIVSVYRFVIKAPEIRCFNLAIWAAISPLRSKSTATR